MDVRRNQTGRVRRIADVDMTGMVDVTFLLLIFFMLTALVAALDAGAAAGFADIRVTQFDHL